MKEEEESVSWKRKLFRNYLSIYPFTVLVPYKFSTSNGLAILMDVGWLSVISTK